jgi:MFS family permease
MNDSNYGRETSGAHYYLWVVLPLATAAQLSQALPRMGLPVLYPFIQDEFGLSRAQVGLITSALSLGFAVLVLLAGWFTDNFGVRRTIIMSLLSFTGFIFAFPLAHSFVVVLVLVVIVSIAACPVQPSTTTAIMDWMPPRIRGLAMSIKQMGVPIAGALTAALLPIIAIATGWRIAAASNGLLVLATAVAFILLYHNAPRETYTASKFSLAPLKNIFRNRDLIITISWGAVFGGFQFITLSYFMLFLIEELDWSPVMAGGMLAIAQFSSIIARVGWGAFSDFIFHGRRMVVLAITGFLTVLWMLGASLTGTGVPGAAVYLITIAIGISVLSYHGVFLALIGEQAEAGQVGTTTGLTMLVYHIVMMLMPPLFGYLVDVTDSYSLAWRVCAVAALVFTVAFLIFGREPQRQ